MLLGNQQKLVLQKVFRIMDTSGDGGLGAEEIAYGYRRLFKGATLAEKFGSEEAANEVLQKVLKRIDKNADGVINFKEFLMGSIHLSPLHFQRYLERAFERLFNNPIQSIEKMAFMDRLCVDNVMPQKTLEAFFEAID